MVDMHASAPALIRVCPAILLWRLMVGVVYRQSCCVIASVTDDMPKEEREGKIGKTDTERETTEGRFGIRSRYLHQIVH